MIFVVELKHGYQPCYHDLQPHIPHPSLNQESCQPCSKCHIPKAFYFKHQAKFCRMLGMAIPQTKQHETADLERSYVEKSDTP